MEEALQETEAAINDIAANETTNEYEQAKARAIATLEKLTSETSAIKNPTLATEPTIESAATTLEQQTEEAPLATEEIHQMQEVEEEAPTTDVAAAVDALEDEPVVATDSINEVHQQQQVVEGE